MIAHDAPEVLAGRLGGVAAEVPRLASTCSIRAYASITAAQRIGRFAQRGERRVDRLPGDRSVVLLCTTRSGSIAGGLLPWRGPGTATPR